jgi:hypothetical protein
MSLICGIALENLNPGQGRSNISGKCKSHELVEADGPISKKRKRCLSCCSQIANAEGTEVALSKTPKVNTYCHTCKNKPYMCVSYFNLKLSIFS